MTKKSTIGAVATLSAFALAAGTAGAHAASSKIDGDIAQSTIVFAGTGPHGTGVTPDTSGGDQAFYELTTSDSNVASADGLSMVGCVGTDDEHPRVFVDPYGNVPVPGTVLPGVRRAADPGFTGVRDDVWGKSGQLDSNDYDLRLVENFGGFPEEVLDQAANGNPNEDCVDSLPPLAP